jgi:hypothetical protein
LVGANECSNERRREQRRPHRIRQTEPNLLDKRARLLDGPDGFALQPPFFAPQLLQFLIGHKNSYQLSALSGATQPTLRPS